MERIDVYTTERPTLLGAKGRDRLMLERLGVVISHLPGYTRLAWRLLRDPRLSQGQRTTIYLGLGYLALPFDFVPGIIPVAGQMDDLAAVILALRSVTRGLPPEVASEHLRGTGLALRDMDDDLKTLGATALWLVERIGGWALRLAGQAAGALWRGAAGTLDLASRRGQRAPTR
ncbi:MAG: YkvA family protein [Chloroflexota bacterium]